MALFFSSLLDPAAAPPVLSGVRRWVPAMDLAETDTHFRVTADLPGMSEDDIAIEFDGDVMTVSGSRTVPGVGEGTTRVRRERASGSFRRSITFPEGIDADAVEATYVHGVLEIAVPKPEERRPRRVQITVGEKPTLVEG